MRALEELVKAYAIDVLKNAGFKRTRMTFLKRNPHGDVVLVRFSSFSVFDEVQFNVELAYVPRLRAIWNQEILGLSQAATPDESHGLWRSHLVPPPEVMKSELGYWAYADEGTETIAGQCLERGLREQALPRLEGFLDREALLKRLDSPDFDEVPEVLWVSPLAAKAFLLVDGPRTPEADSVLEQLKQEGHGPVDFLERHYPASPG